MYHIYFNMTMSYHRSADVVRPYGLTVDNNGRAHSGYYDQEIIDSVHHRLKSSTCEHFKQWDTEAKVI